MDDFKPIVGGVYNFFDAFFDDGGVVADISEDIDDVGVMFDGRFVVDPIDDGDVDDEIDTADFENGKYAFKRLIDLPAWIPVWLFRFGGMLQLTVFATMAGVDDGDGGDGNVDGNSNSKPTTIIVPS